MELFLKHHWFKLLAGVVVLAAVGVVLYTKFSTPALPVEGKAANFELTNVDGKKVTMDSTEGKVRLVYFFWASCPDVCLPTTHMISKVQEGLKKEGIYGSQTRLLSITFDPVRDTSEYLKQFAQKNSADLSGWYFLRGDEEYTKQIANKYGVAIAKDKDNNFIHTNRIVLVDQEGNIRKAYNGMDLDLKTDEIVQDMKGLVAE